MPDLRVQYKESKRRITLDEVKVAFTTTKPVPNIYKKTPSAMERIATLEAEVANLRALVSEMSGAVEVLKVSQTAAEPYTAVGEKRARS